MKLSAKVCVASGPGDQEVAGQRARDIARERKVEDILREPVILIDEDLDEVAGGFLNINFNNFDSNQGTQAGLQNVNFDSNQGFQNLIIL